MKQVIFFLSFVIAAGGLQAQSVISGKVTNNKSEPLPSATVRVKESGKAVKTDTSGFFILHNQEAGAKTLRVSSVGYTSTELPLTLKDSSLKIDVILESNPNMLGNVIVSAGSFEASDKAKGASLTPIDAVTVAGNGGDISNALRSLPGAQQIGDKEGLFVRGGTSEETRQFVDGTLMPVPNYSSVPGIIQPARINPFVFSGILFNTGGYSALYGEALSSALILESVDLPGESSASLHIFPMGQGAGFQSLARNKKSSWGINTNYSNYALTTAL